MAAQAWTCRRCGSSDKRPNGKGCAECHRQREQKPQHPGLTLGESRLFSRLLRDDFTDITVTEPMRAYLQAFDAYLTAGKAGALRTLRHAKVARRHTLTILEGPVHAPLPATRSTQHSRSLVSQ